MNGINYGNDLLKHYVRRNGWLKASQQQKHTISNRLKKIPLRYFTFCAAEAIDVFMLVHENIVKRSEETGRLEGVYFCEMDDESFGIIADLIGSPEQGFHGPFEKIVLFEDDEDTIGNTLEDDSYYPPEIRGKLGYKDAHSRLREAFPFDIINLDVWGGIFPPRKGILTPLLRSIIKILEWQTESHFKVNKCKCNQFTLFLTSHIYPYEKTDEEVIKQLQQRLNDNICTSPIFEAAFMDHYGHVQVEELASEKFAEFFCIAFPKFIIHKSLFDLGWEVRSGPTYLYNRPDKYVKNGQYQIMHSVSVFERISGFGESLDIPNMNQYFQSVIQLINDEIKWVDNIVDEPNIANELAENLDQIKKIRDQRHILE